MALTKTDLANQIFMISGFSKKESADILETLFETLKSSLANGEKIKISGFGNFSVSSKAPRRGRNPQTGEAIEISARKIVNFKPSMLLKQQINEDQL